jgi:hypothetical protein
LWRLHDLLTYVKLLEDRFHRRQHPQDAFDVLRRTDVVAQLSQDVISLFSLALRQGGQGEPERRVIVSPISIVWIDVHRMFSCSRASMLGGRVSACRAGYATA